MLPSLLGFSFLDSRYVHAPSPAAGLNLFLLQPPFLKRLPFHHLQPLSSVCRSAISTRASPEPLSVAVPRNLLNVESLYVLPFTGFPISVLGAAVSAPGAVVTFF